MKRLQHRLIRTSFMLPAIGLGLSLLTAAVGCARVVATEPFGDPVPAEVRGEADARLAGVWRHGETLMLCRRNQAGELTLTRVAWDDERDAFTLSPTPVALRMLESAGLGLVFLDEAALGLPGSAGDGEQTNWLVLRLVSLQGDSMALASGSPQAFAELIEADRLEGAIRRDREGAVNLVTLTSAPAQAARVVAEENPDLLFPTSRVVTLSRIARWDEQVEVAGEALIDATAAPAPTP